MDLDFIIDTNPDTGSDNSEAKTKKSIKKKIFLKKKDVDKKKKKERPLLDTEKEPAFEVDTRPSKTKKTNLTKKKKSKISAKNLITTQNNKERELTEALFGSTFDLGFSEEISPDFDTLEENSEEEDVKNSTYEGVESNLLTQPATKKRKAAWVDDDDEETKVKDVVATFSKARGTRGQREVSDAKYQDLLKERFSDLYGSSPVWAELDRKVDDDEEEEDESSDMKTKTSTYLASKDCVTKLPKTSLNFKLVSNLNKDSYREGSFIKSIDFDNDLQIALVSGYSTNKFGSATLFQFGGKKNFKIKNVIFPNFPVQCARLIPNRRQFIVGSNLYGRFFVYDIEEGKKIDVPWQHNPTKNSMKNFEVTPDGNYIAFLSSGGGITFYDASSLSVFETLRIPCEVTAIDFSPDSSVMYSFGDNGRVYIFDLVNWCCTHSFFDDGSIAGTAIAASPNGRLLSCGSSSGIVNVYDVSSLGASDTPTPLKSFGSLVTPITSLAFNATSEVLATASSFKDNAIKLIHTGSLTYFANFPGAYSVRRIQTIKFSPDSKYLAAGSNVKIAHLFRLFYY